MSKNSCCLAEFTDFLGMNKCKCHINQQSITANSVKIMASIHVNHWFKKKPDFMHVQCMHAPMYTCM